MRRSLRGVASPETVDAVLTELNSLWEDADSVSEADRMAFTLAVVEASANVVLHAVPMAEGPVELRVDVVAEPGWLQAKIYEIGAAPAEVDPGPRAPADAQDETGRGLSLIQALVTEVVHTRRGADNVWELRRDCRGPARRGGLSERRGNGPAGSEH